MILKKLEVSNFRQFRGQHTIEFATEPTHNVTLVMGYNTFGKSALLNAINFALFGEVQSDLDKSDELLNTTAQGKGEKQFSIGLDFEFDGNSYHIQRDRIYTYRAGGKTTFVDQPLLHQINSQNGSWTEIQMYQQLINRAIPKEMAPHFIFHGEKRIHQFSSSGTHKEVGDAIRKILGCNVIEIAIADLLHLGKKLERVVVKESGDQQIEDMQRSLESFEAQLKDVNDKIQRKDDEIEAAQIEIDKISQELRDHDRTKELKNLLDRAESGRKASIDNRNKIQREIWRWIKDSAIVVSSAAVSQTALDAIDEEEVRGKIPSDYQESFIRGLLEAHKCICNREIEDGSPEWNAVLSLLEKGGRRDVLDFVLRVKAGAERYSRSIAKAKNDLSILEDRSRSLQTEIASYEREIEEYTQRLKGVDVEELAAKAEKYSRLQSRIKSLSQQIGDLQRKKKVQIEPEMQKVRSDIERKLRSRPEFNKKRRVLELVTDLVTFLSQQLQNYEEEARNQVLTLTNENLSVMHRDKEAYFDAKFNLGLREKDTKLQGGKSTGESQLLVLAFTSALIKFCSQREGQEDEFLVPGTVAPLVLDAPFGQLDTVFQRGAISWIPKMARQVILFVSDSQARILQESKDAMERVGACYVIQIPSSERKTPPYQIAGNQYPSQSTRTDASTVLQRIW